jgi:hypothetical protein
MIVINTFERSCGTFRGGGGKNPLLSMTLGQFPQNKTKQKTKNIYFKIMTMGWMLIY